MAFFFDRWAVTMAFRAEHPADTSVDEATLLALDGSLKARYEVAMHDAAGDAGIPLTRENVSFLLILAVVGADGTPGKQMKNACAYFNSVRPHLPTSSSAPVVLAAPGDGG